MTVVFVFSGNSEYFPISPFIQDQALSLARLGIDVKFYAIRGNGPVGYLSNVKKLRRYIKLTNIDIIHAHYALCALVSVLTFTRKPVICSYMGNDILGEYNSKGKLKISSCYMILLSVMIQPFLSHAICKSTNTSKAVLFVKYSIIPNGVDFSLFRPNGGNELRDVKKVLFLGNPSDQNKNINLLIDALKLLPGESICLVTPYPTPHEDLPMFFNDADVFVLCSIVEGSPNVVKEAMACDCPIVATNVGNVKWLLGDVDGHFVVNHDAEELAGKIAEILANGRRSQGRGRLLELNLDSESVAKRIEAIYIKLTGR